MSIVKFGSIVTSGSGSLGGSTIQPFRSTHVLRKKPLPPHSSTPAQRLIRSYNKTMQAGWRSLTDQARSLWNNYAKEKPVFNRSGEKHPLSGHSLWMKYQYPYASRNIPFLDDPANFGPPYYGPELLISPNFDSPTGWYIDPSVEIAGSLCSFLNTSGSVGQRPNIIPGTSYRIGLELYSYTSGLVYLTVFGSNVIIGTVPGIYYYNRAGAANNRVLFWSRYALGTFSLKWASVKEIVP